MNLMIGMCRYAFKEEKLEDICGDYNMKKSTVRVDCTMEKDMKRQTACHEIAHIFLRSAFASEHAEANAEALGDMFYKFLIENEPFIKWIRDK